MTIPAIPSLNLAMGPTVSGNGDAGNSSQGHVFNFNGGSSSEGAKIPNWGYVVIFGALGVGFLLRKK